MNYLFGPVTSRRLGFSLGIDLIPAKICTFNCIYCEIGPTTRFTCKRGEYCPTTDIIAEIDTFLDSSNASRPVDVFTITGSGEPTLHSGLGDIIAHIKSRSGKPVAVLTNGSLLTEPEVRQALAAADIVMPSLDAAREESFRAINRPAGCVQLSAVIDGLASFCRSFAGEVWLEILLARGINDSESDINALRLAAEKIKPTKIQLNTVARPPLESFALPVNETELKSVAARLPGEVEIIADFTHRSLNAGQPAHTNELLEMLKRRPCTEADICETLHLTPPYAGRMLHRLMESGDIIQTEHQGKLYYQTSRTP